MLAECTLQLFEGCNAALVDARPAPSHTHVSSTFAVIGFAGKQMRGSLVLFAYPGVLRASYPTPGEVSEEDLLGWAGELSNQLLGRIKNKLLTRGITIDLSTPTAMTGHGMRFATALPTSQLLERTFGYAGEPVLVRLEARASEGVELMAPDPGPTSNEGDMILF
jgi:chemotaxis protein CheX